MQKSKEMKKMLQGVKCHRFGKSSVYLMARAFVFPCPSPQALLFLDSGQRHYASS